MKQVYTSTRKNVLSLIALVLISLSSFAGTITIPAGTTVNHTAGLAGDVFEVYGTLNFNPANYNSPGNKINIYNGGVVNVASSNPASIVIDVRFGGTLNFTAATVNFTNAGGGIKNAGTVDASNSDFTSNGTGLENSGLFKVKSLTINNALSSTVLRKNTGTINITNRLTVNALYENGNLGSINISGGDELAFTTHQNSNLTNNGTLDITGKAEVNGDLELNGTMIVRGDLTIKRKVSGVNGKLGVVGGVSTLMSQGYYEGSNMLFCDQNSSAIGNNFDVNSTGNNKSVAGTNYTINCAAVFAASEGPLPLRFVSFESVEYNQFSVYFKFTTTEEYNIKTIQLQGSTDGSNYTAIENIAPHNTNGTHQYTTAKTETAKYTAYRVAVIDLDGKVAYSKIVFVKATTKTVEASIFPNPITNGSFTVKVSSAEPTIVNVFSNDGKILFNTVLKGQLQYQVKMPNTGSQQSMIIIQVIQNGTIKTFNVLSK